MGEAEEHELNRRVITLKIKVIYFATAREAAATREEQLTVPAGASTADLAAEIVRRHPNLDRVMESARFSINFDLVQVSGQLHDGDEVGVLPPLAGG